jgi:hypothetical protein
MLSEAAGPAKICCDTAYQHKGCDSVQRLHGNFIYILLAMRFSRIQIIKFAQFIENLLELNFDLILVHADPLVIGTISCKTKAPMKPIVSKQASGLFL